MSIGTMLRQGFSETRFVVTAVLLLILLRFPYSVLVDLVLEGDGAVFSLPGLLVTGLEHVASLFFTPLIIAGILRKLIDRAAQQPPDEKVKVNIGVSIYPRMLALYILYLMTVFALMLPMLFVFGFLGIRLALEGAGADQLEAQISQLSSSPLWLVLSFLASTATNLVWCLWCVACVILVDTGSTLDTSIRRALTFCKRNITGFLAVWLITLALDLPSFAFYWLAGQFKLLPPSSVSSQAVWIFPAVWNAITLAVGLSLATSLFMARRLAIAETTPAGIAR